jgi:hypothetical protein
MNTIREGNKETKQAQQRHHKNVNDSMVQRQERPFDASKPSQTEKDAEEY